MAESNSAFGSAGRAADGAGKGVLAGICPRLAGGAPRVGAGASGVSLYSYRHSWAQRAKSCGYPQRFAQEALGHTSRAVHEAYAKGATVICPPLDEYEIRKPSSGENHNTADAAG